MNTSLSLDINRQQEDRDLMEIKKINDDIREMESKKHKIVQRLVSRYQSGVSESDINRHKSPIFDDPLQQHSYNYLVQVGSSSTKPMSDYAKGKGYDFADAPKPGLKIVQSLKKRTDIFSYDSKTEKWSLLETTH